MIWMWNVLSLIIILALVLRRHLPICWGGKAPEVHNLLQMFPGSVYGLQNAIGWVTPEGQKLTPHSGGGWKSGSLGQVADFFLYPPLGKGPQALWASWYGHSLLLNLRALPLWCDHTRRPRLLTLWRCRGEFPQESEEGAGHSAYSSSCQWNEYMHRYPPKTCAHFNSR